MKKEPLTKIAPELVDLTIYCKAVSMTGDKVKKIADFQTDEDDASDEMSSFSETKAREVMIDDGNRSAFQWRHKKHLARIYPKVWQP